MTFRYITINKLETSFGSKRFVRVHRFSFVNLGQVSRVLREDRADGWLVLTNSELRWAELDGKHHV